jgi:HEAT repeat protein
LLDEDEMEYLLESLKDEDPHVRVFTINSIVDNSNNKSAIPSLIKCLFDEFPEVRSRAAWALGKIEATEAMDELVKALRDKDWRVRKNAARALGDMYAFDAITELVWKLEDENWEVRSEAAVVLEYLGWIPKNVDEEVLNFIAKEKWEDLLVLEKINLYKIINFLEDQDKDVRSKTAWILGETGDSEAVQPLFDLFMIDINNDVKVSAAKALGKIGTTKVVDLLHVAIHDKDWFIKQNAAEILGIIGDKSSIEPLEKLLEDDNPFVQKSAQEALLKIKKKI